MSVFSVSPLLFFFIGLSPFVFANAAVYFVKFCGGIRINIRREAVKWIFWVYALIVLALCCFPVHYTAGPGLQPILRPVPLNLTPFSSFSQVFHLFGLAQFPLPFKLASAFCTLLFPALLFVPLGFLLPHLHKVFRGVIAVLGAALIFSLFVEAARYAEASFGLVSERAFCIDTVILSIAGAAAGFYLSRTIFKKFCKKAHFD